MVLMMDRQVSVRVFAILARDPSVPPGVTARLAPRYALTVASSASVRRFVASVGDPVTVPVPVAAV
jgi:hypothetical protein